MHQTLLFYLRLYPVLFSLAFSLSHIQDCFSDLSLHRIRNDKGAFKRKEHWVLRALNDSRFRENREIFKGIPALTLPLPELPVQYSGCHLPQEQIATATSASYPHIRQNRTSTGINPIILTGFWRIPNTKIR